MVKHFNCAIKSCARCVQEMDFAHGPRYLSHTTSKLTKPRALSHDDQGLDTNAKFLTWLDRDIDSDHPKLSPALAQVMIHMGASQRGLMGLYGCKFGSQGRLLLLGCIGPTADSPLFAGRGSSLASSGCCSARFKCRLLAGESIEACPPISAQAGHLSLP